MWVHILWFCFAWAFSILSVVYGKHLAREEDRATLDRFVQRARDAEQWRTDYHALHARYMHVLDMLAPPQINVGPEGYDIEPVSMAEADRRAMERERQALEAEQEIAAGEREAVLVDDDEIPMPHRATARDEYVDDA